MTVGPLLWRLCPQDAPRRPRGARALPGGPPWVSWARRWHEQALTLAWGGHGPEQALVGLLWVGGGRPCGPRGTPGGLSCQATCSPVPTASWLWRDSPPARRVCTARERGHLGWAGPQEPPDPRTPRPQTLLGPQEGGPTGERLSDTWAGPRPRGDKQQGGQGLGSGGGPGSASRAQRLPPGSRGSSRSLSRRPVSPAPCRGVLTHDIHPCLAARFNPERWGTGSLAWGLGPGAPTKENLSISS